MHQAVPDQAADVPAVRRAEEHEAAGSAAVPDSQQRSGMLGSQILKFRTQDLPLDIHPTNHPFAGLWSGHIWDPEPAVQVLLECYLLSLKARRARGQGGHPRPLRKYRPSDRDPTVRNR